MHNPFFHISDASQVLEEELAKADSNGGEEAGLAIGR
jgi:hypothetical protein